MAGSLASINIKFFADLKQFSTAMQNSERQIKKMGRNLTKVGKNLTVGLTAPLAAMAAVSLKSFNDQAKAIAQVEAGLKSTGNAVGYTSEELQKMASDLQNTTLFGDEEILKGATSQLLTFTNIAGVQFERTQVAALDLATRLDGDLKSASIQLGKALNDPVANLSALSRSGIQFSEDQKKTINALVETNRLADAQTLILNELEKQYGGSAAAAAEAGTGGLTQLGNILGDVTEDFGAIINEAIKPFVAKIKELALSFNALSPATKKIIVIVGALAAALGPLLVALGFLMTTVIPGLITAFGGLSTAFSTLTATMLANPITAILVLLAAAATALFLFAERADDAAAAQRRLNEAIKEGAASANENKLNGSKALQVQIDQIKRVAQTELESTNNLKEQAEIKKKAVQEITNLIVKERNAVNERVVAYANQMAQYKEGSPERARYNELIKQESDYYNELTQKIKNVTVEKKKLAVVDAPPTATRAKVTGVQSAGAVGGFAIPELGKDIGLAEKTTATYIEQWNGSVELGMASIASSFAEGFGNIIGGLVDGSASMADVGGLLLETVANIATSLGKAAIEIGVGMLAIKLAFTNPLAAIAAGVALIAVGALIKSVANITASGGGGSRRAFADGGIVYGPTNALIGEYAGASSNPEVVAPLDKLQDLINPGGGQNIAIEVTGSFEASGDKMQLVLDRNSKRKSRTS